MILVQYLSSMAAIAKDLPQKKDGMPSSFDIERISVVRNWKEDTLDIPKLPQTTPNQWYSDTCLGTF